MTRGYYDRMAVVGVLGASGETGRVVARLLADHSDATLVLFGRRAAPIEALRTRLPDPGRAEVRAVDATAQPQFLAALDGVDVVVAAAPLLDRLKDVLLPVLAAGADWIDVFLDSPDKWELLDRIAPSVPDIGRRVITGAGMHPGLAAVLVRAVARQFDTLTRAAVAQLVAPDWPSQTVTADTVTEFARELGTFDMAGLRKGKWQKLPISSSARIDFGEPFGRRLCTPMALEEIRGLIDLYPALTDAVLYMAGFNPVTDWVVMPACMAMMQVSPRWTDRAARLLFWSLKRFGKPPYGSVAQVVAAGTGHDPVRLSVRYDEGGYWLTAAVAAATTLQCLDGTIAEPGVHIEGLVTDPVRLLSELQAWGAKVEGLSDQTPPRSSGG